MSNMICTFKHYKRTIKKSSKFIEVTYPQISNFNQIFNICVVILRAIKRIWNTEQEF